LSSRQSSFHLEVAGGEHIGGRRAHEDFYSYDAALGLLAVADGVSSRPAGRIAAETAVGTLFSRLTDPRVPLLVDPRERLEDALLHAHRRVRDQAAADQLLRGMATTLACVMEEGDILVVGHVGDSRVLRLREGQLQRLTVDHRVDTDLLVRRQLPPEALKTYGPNTLTRGIGLGEKVVPEIGVEPLLPDDGVLVTTDGLTAVVDDATIAATLLRHRSPQAAVNALIRCALDAGAPDNIACVYAHWRRLA
jgi:protein phosphatase